MLRRIAGPQRKQATGSRRALHSEMVHNVYPSPDIIKVIKRKWKWAEHVACMGDIKMHTDLARKQKGKRLLGRPRHNWMILKWILEK